MATVLTGKTARASGEGDKSDDLLMLAYSRGSLAAFDELYARYKQPLFVYLYRNCSGQGVAEELFQDIWLKVVASARRYTGKGKFRPWLFTLAHNCLVDHYRKAGRQERERPLGEEIADEGAAPAPDGHSGASSLRIDRALMVLPLEQRQAVWLRELSGFSTREIASIQGVSTEAARSRLRYAYKKLRTLLMDIDHET